MEKLITLAIAVYASLAGAAQPGVPKPISAPLRDLQFGDVNFLHTTDTHGWHAGHLLEPSYGADWGDYVDFSDRMREKVEADGKDLLVVDTGDRIEGNGLYDGDEPKGKHTFEIFTKQHIDIICIGNHELYKKNSSENELNITVPAYHESYIASNLDILDHNGEFIPLAPRYRKFTTRVQGLKIMAFGFIFNFQRNDHNTKITPVEDAIRQEWFQQAIRDHDVDLFVVIGHAGIRSDEFRHVYQAIRSQKWDTPIQFFGGHVHVRDAIKFDSNAYGLASGRFMETIGFQSISGLAKSKYPSLNSNSNSNSIASSQKFFRRYIDNNLYSYYHHTGLNQSTFHSKRGQEVSNLIQQGRKDLKLDSVFGCAPQDYWMQRAPFPSNNSVFTLLNDTIIPEIVVQQDRANISRLILVNTGAIRFDIFKGPFTKDSTFIVSPFTSGMHYLPNIPYDQAIQLLRLINQGDTPTQTGASSNRRRLGPPQQYSHNLQQQLLPSTAPSQDDKPPTKLTLGYVTTDGIDNQGDDTLHDPIPINPVPNVIQSLIITSQIADDHIPNPDSPSDSPSLSLSPSASYTPETIDVIFNEFLQPNVLDVLRQLKQDHSNADVHPYMHGENMTDMISRWIALNWGVYCDNKMLSTIEDEL